MVIFISDDQSQVDVGYYGAKGVKTTQVDRIGRQGMRFTDTHSSASTCTPSRFALFTGSYAFRNKAAILPTVYVDNHHVVGLKPDDPIDVSYLKKIGNEPTLLSHPKLLKVAADIQHSASIFNCVSRIGYMMGGKAARWEDEEFHDVLTQKAKAFMREHQDKSFFLYFSFHDFHVPHVPWVPNPCFISKSKMGPRGDAIVQMDWCTGENIETLEKMCIAGNTLVLFTSDNGAVLDAGYEDQAAELVGVHNPSWPFRGGGGSTYEAGTRVPTITYLPVVIRPGESNALLSQVDLYASQAKLAGQEVSPAAATDSKEMLSVWMGKSEEGRKKMIEEAFVLAFRKEG